MEGMDEIRDTFFQEAEELLGELERGLILIQEGDRDSETVNAIFRAVHSIKGGAGMFELDRLVSFAHAFETVLDDLRSRKIGLEANGLKTMLRSADLLSDLVRTARAGEEMEAGREAVLMAELAALSGGVADAAPSAFDAPELPAGPVSRLYDIRFTPLAALYANAGDPALLVRELHRLGTATVSCDASHVPDLSELDPEGAYLSWTVALETTESEDTIREVFEFVEGDCILEVIAGEPMVVEEPAVVEEGDGFDVAALLARMQAELGDGPAPEATPSPFDMPFAPDFSADFSNVVDLADMRPVETPAPSPAPAVEPVAAPVLAASPAKTEESKASSAPAPAAGATIRVDLDRLDRLVNLVGELVINRAMVAQRVVEAGLSNTAAVSVGLDELEQLTREIQDNVMALRAQPVRSVFQRMSRLVREVGEAVNKQVQLVVEGEGTEVDKTIVERLTDPLTHMIRNAIDHGLESPEKRLEAGKPLTGTVHLSARHASGHIVIEVSDDGGGLNRPRVRDIAVSKGLIPADAQLSDEETDNLIFLPGFSTASTISNISGRGVGLDVVKRSVQALGGRISIASRPGRGSTFTLALPLTLAVLDGMLVTVADQTLVLPLTSTVETLKLKPEEIHALGSSKLVTLRGAFTPMIDVGRHFGYRHAPADLTKSVGLVVETQGNTRTVLLVDEIQGQRQVVIKSLETNYGSVPGIAAATILGDGRVALILDVDALVSEASASASDFSFAIAG
ncbi:chemotaxis protein CheA [Mesorhizobium sp. RP14(2022)]|uniref:Chemotaxis protein CheA n=1 Tax=Mesorhizobium liriopis TaxID=2953882 RepID=A0ABT1C897_9HYPH|nr:chemotaxis protein CheA [Mesorhizobium liriopis]MCO6051063.1 chemotaxis protein CheA [Mesorhizobium liriopis]